MKAATTPTGSNPLFHFIGGKGGVGKTTCAAAFALAEASAGVRVLVASTDPAPSLGDAFKVRLSGSPRPVRSSLRVASGSSRTPPRRCGRLHAVEIDAPAVLRRWISERRGALETIALQGTWLDREDVATLLSLSLPGIDEVAALLEIARLARTGRYDLIVVDTAPTGHTLRMLSMPETLFGIAQVFDRMHEKHRVMVEALRGGWRPDDEDTLIHDLAGEARGLSELLRDSSRTRLSWVTLPEPMAIAETRDAVAALENRGIAVTEIIVNRLTPPARQRTRCGHCDARRTFEARALRHLPALERILVSARDTEPRGLAALARIGRELQHPQPPSRIRRSSTSWAASVGGSPVTAGKFVTRETRLLIFGGKGGVGKTTCAAAAAIAAAARWPVRRVLLISTDPAHSLGDVLGAKVTDQPGRVRGAPANLSVREMDSVRVFLGVREKYAAAIDQLFERLGGGGSFDISHDRSVMHGLIDLAPPGLDEVAAVIEITDAVSSTSSELVVIDTAPTGHALRLLEMPELIHDWTKALMAILLKYQPVTGLGELGTLLLKLSKGLGRLRELLADHARTRFVVVTRAAVLPRAESARLVQTLQRLDIEVPLVIVNAVGRGRCGRCVKAAAVERREIEALRRIVAPSRSSRVLAAAVTRIPPPRSPSGLRAWQRTGWRYHQDA